MKLIIFALLIIVLAAHPSLQQCDCKQKCTKCCKSGDFRLVPLYELFNPKTGLYFYTVSLRELNAALTDRGFVRKRVLGLVAVGEVDCKKTKTLVPVKRSVNRAGTDYLYQTTDDPHPGQIYNMEGVAFYGASTQNNCGAAVPVYRFWDGKTHTYYTDLADGKQKAGPNAINEGIVCYIWPVTEATPEPPVIVPRDPFDNPGSCSLALTKYFHLIFEATDTYLFTPSFDEAKSAYDNRKFNTLLSPGYVSPGTTSCRCNLIAVYRVDRADPKQDQLYTTNKKEAEDAVSGQGYKNLQIAFYGADKLNGCGASIPYYRFKRNNALANHYYTSDPKDKVALQSTNEGVLCHIWPQQA